MSVKTVLRESGLPLLESRRSVPICVLLENGRLKQDSHQTVSAPIAPLESTTTSRLKPMNLIANHAKKASTTTKQHDQIASSALKENTMNSQHKLPSPIVNHVDKADTTPKPDKLLNLIAKTIAKLATTSTQQKQSAFPAKKVNFKIYQDNQTANHATKEDIAIPTRDFPHAKTVALANTTTRLDKKMKPIA
jgi:hypothetical protein